MKRKTDWLALAARLEKFSARQDEIKAKPRDLETLAKDYPEAWPDLQKRRRVLKWENITMAGILAWLPLGCLAQYLGLARDWVDVGKSALPLFMLGSAALLLLLRCYTTRFVCPRCGGYFVEPDSKSGPDLNDPDAECRKCHLHLGEKPG